MEISQKLGCIEHQRLTAIIVSFLLVYVYAILLLLLMIWESIMYRFDIYDEVFPSRQATFAMSFELPTLTTAKDILKERIKREYDNKDSILPIQRVIPSADEKRLNGEKQHKHTTHQTKKSWQTAFDKAVKAFAENGFVLIIDDEQVLDLDKPLAVKAETAKVVFLKLIPLQGG